MQKAENCSFIWSFIKIKIFYSFVQNFELDHILSVDFSAE